METNISNNIIILAIVALVVLYILFMIMREKFRKSLPAKKNTTIKKSGSVDLPSLMDNKKNRAPALPRNETLYQIVKNNVLVTNLIPFDLHYILDELVSLMRSDIRNDNIELIFDIDPATPMQLIGSPKRLSRILINLISNSIHATTEGIVVLSIKVLDCDTKECQLLFKVSDQGYGMNESQIQELFVDPMHKNVDKRNRLGFFVANALVKESGSQISVDSTLHQGTVVQFKMKLEIPSKRALEAHQEPSEECKELRVLIIEKYNEVAIIYKKLMEPYVKSVEIVVPMSNMIDQDLASRYDLVICDYAFVKNTLIDTIKQNGAHIVISQNIFSKSSIDKHILFSTDYLITKPFTNAHIAEMLTVLYGSRATADIDEIEGFVSSKVATDRASRAAAFISDAEIPITGNVSKKDFIDFVGSKILIVEDNPINQRVIKGLLGDSGMSLYFAEDGVSALDILEDKAPFDLILMDINMPVLDGFDTTERIRENSRYDSMPVVAFTGLNLQDQIEKMREVGMNAHMAKPLNIGRFYSVFAHFLQKRNMD